MICSVCTSKIPDTAKVCTRCEMPAVAAKRQNAVLTIVFPIGAVIAALLIITAAKTMSAPPTPDTVKDQCVASQARGGWNASLGVSLDQFCAEMSRLNTEEVDRRQHLLGN
jgi:predicted nucleic acid-binding Zn ribbon protein